MIRSLSIRNFAIIDRLNMEFGPGFNVLTGETGAGKSILMDALNLLLGARAGTEMVRAGAGKASVDAVFDVSDAPELNKIVTDMGFDIEDDELFLSRDVSSAGKSACRISGRPATVAQLREIGDFLVDLHGQHEHQSLMAVNRHIDMLDDWGGKPIQTLRAQVGEAFQTMQRLKREKASLESDARERTHLLDLYQFQVKEIKEAELTVGEDDELATEYKRVSNGQKLADSAASAITALSGGDSGGGAIEAISVALRLLEDAASIDEMLTPALELVRTASYELDEAERDLTRYQDTLEFDPERLEQIEERLETLRKLKRKYGSTIEEVLAYGAEVSSKLDTLTNSEERGMELDAEIAKADKKLRELCAKLSKLRREAGAKFQTTTLAELRDLAMDKTRFEVRIEPGEPTAKGADKVEFLIAPNPGEPLKPLAKVASGGEISRVTLAIKSAMAKQETLPTMVFDEIDVGVGGRTASVIADKLKGLSRSAQILCITHLAQLASKGDTHFLIEKRVEADRTATTVVPLDPDQRVAEIARMIGGAEVTDTVLQHAREMLSFAGGK